MKKVTETYQLVIVGGGLAGFCAAISAARLGTKTCLVHNRPVFGGNSSSEIRVTPHGAAAFHAYARETGVLSELLIEERAKNHEEIFENGWTNSVWDLTLYNMAQSTPHLTFHLNTDIQAIGKKEDRTIDYVIGIVQNAEVQLTLFADIFVDCTGDGIIADKAGCEWRMGTEGKEEFNEPHAPEKASGDTMGNSIHFKTKNMGFQVPFKAPDWAMHYEDAGFFYEQGRLPKQEKGGFWWLEIGVPYHTVHDNENIRHELTRHALGVWDWMKNKDPRMKEICKNYALDWIGQVPGKRESRRIMGEYLMTEHDPLNCTVFDDEVAFGGWFIDLHTPGGLLASGSEPTNNENYDTFTDYSVKSYAGPYGIPLRSLMAKNVDNLMMAGRNISVTHAALGTVRVMATTALMGQAVGTAASIALNKRISIKKIPFDSIIEVQQQLLRDGCFLPNYKNKDPKDLAQTARLLASSEALEYGAGQESKGAEEGLSFWKDQPQYVETTLNNRRGQVIAVGNEEITSLAICVDNLSDSVQVLDLKLLSIEHIWDYRIHQLPELASTQLEVPTGKNHWITWPLHLKNLAKGTLVRLDALPNSNLKWHVAGRIETGQLAMYQIGENKMRRFGNGHTLSFKVVPPQACFSPINAISGVTRPYRFTNLWKSDPNQPLTQWLELNWDQNQTVTQIELTFPGHLIREYHAYAPFYRDPQCPKDYSIAAWVEEHWQTLVNVEDNYQRQRKHTLPVPVMSSKIRINIHATNGDPSAQVYEVRCY